MFQDHFRPSMKLTFSCILLLCLCGLVYAAGEIASPVLLNPLADLSLAQLHDTRGRPLFTVNRRPPVPPAPSAVVPREVSAPPPPPDPPKIFLLGVVGNGQSKHAIIQPDSAETNSSIKQASNNIRKIKIGDDVGGWVVTDIQSRCLMLMQESRMTTFTLFEGKGARRRITARIRSNPQQ